MIFLAFDTYYFFTQKRRQNKYTAFMPEKLKYDIYSILDRLLESMQHYLSSLIENKTESSSFSFASKFEATLKMSFSNVQMAKTALENAKASYYTAKQEYQDILHQQSQSNFPDSHLKEQVFTVNQAPSAVADLGTIQQLADNFDQDLKSLQGELDRLHIRVKDVEKKLQMKQGNNVEDLRDKLITENPRSSSTAQIFGKSGVYGSRHRDDRRAPLASRDPYVRRSFSDREHDQRPRRSDERKQYIPGAKFYKRYAN